MYEKGDLIYYGNTGVYCVEDIGPLGHIRGCDPNKKYYKLTSIRRGEVTYVPVDTGVFMRPVLTQGEAETLLGQVHDIAERCCDSREPRVLRAYYQEMLDAHCGVELFRLIKSVNAKGRKLAAQGKRLGKTDQDYKKRAEHLLGEELAAALAVPLDSAQRLLSQALTR
jgi:CarD family transcriptional regulator